MTLQQRVTEEFRRRYLSAPTYIIRAPGRVNLIGEHTDYNDGFVLPMAIDRAVWIALRPRDDRQIHLHSLDFNQTATFDLDHFEPGDGRWLEYVKGVAWALQEADYRLAGWEGVLGGDVPIGSGLSSSAALEVAATRAFAAVAGYAWEPAPMARLAQQAENEWVGVNSGIMDQMISAAGRARHALLIDCRSLALHPVPLPPDTAVIVLDTTTRRGLVDSAYNERQAQCQAAADFFGVTALRDIDKQQFEARASALPQLVRQRARHVISENERTLEAAAAMRQGDSDRLGRLMNDSHASLRDDFDVSSEELNWMVACAQQQAGCYGARMTGAGFGGCAVALVEAAVAESFATAVDHCYQKRSGLTADIYICSAGNGAELISPADESPGTRSIP